MRFLPAALRQWDDLLGDESKSIDALALSFFEDERPLHGVAGLVDWRLCGRVSRLVKAGRVSGKSGDSVMMPAGRRLPFRRLFLFGLGRGVKMEEERFRSHASWMGDVLKRAGATQYALQPPGRATGLITARRAAELWHEETMDEGNQITVIDSAGVQKEMGDILVGSSAYDG